MSGTQADGSASGGDRRWDVTWEDVERAQLEAMLRATPTQRLAWLEDAIRLALASGALEARRESAAAGEFEAAEAEPGGESSPGCRRIKTPSGS